jgi:hypothetical protein
MSSAHFVDDEPGPIEKFSAMSPERFTEWGRAQTERHWETNGGWHLFVEKQPKVALRLLHESAERGVWIVPPWYVALGRFEQSQDLPAKLTKQIATLLVSMPVETLSELGLPASRWLEKARKSLPKRLRQTLWRRIWRASLLEPAPDAALNFNLTLNHAGGLLGGVLYDEMAEYIPRIAAGEHPGLPGQLQSDFEWIAEDDSASAKLARVRMAPMLVVLYRIDPDWTARSLLRRMDSRDEGSFEPHLWEGYLWSPRISDDLLAAFKDSFFEILTHLDRIPQDVREHAAQLFIHMAIPPDRGVSTAEAHDILYQLAPDSLADAAWTLRNIVSGANEKSLALWRETIGPWFERAWPKRPHDRSNKLSKNLVWMGIDGGDAFPEIIAAISDLITPEEWQTSLYHLNQKERETRLISRFPQAALLLSDKLVGDRTHVSDTLRSVLDCIVQAAPELRADIRFQRLLLRAE